METKILQRRSKLGQSPKPLSIKHSSLFDGRYWRLFRCLQIQWSALDVDGGCDSLIFPPKPSRERFPRIGIRFFFALVRRRFIMPYTRAEITRDHVRSTRPQMDGQKQNPFVVSACCGVPHGHFDSRQSLAISLEDTPFYSTVHRTVYLTHNRLTG